MRYLSAIRAASIAAWKHCDGLEAATTGTGLSPLRPKSTISRSACSGFVGIPVDGPARWMSRMSSGSSSITPRPDHLRLEHDARPGRGRDAERAAERRTERRAAGGDLVLGLERRDAEVLVARELLEDRRRRRDRVGAEEERQAGELRGGDQPVADRRVAGDLPVAAGRELRRRDLVRDGEVLGGLAVVVARLEGARVRLGDRRAACRTSPR